MTREQLEHAIRAAGAICGDRELYVVGSQAILGSCPDANPDLLSSLEVDLAPKNRPELESVIEGSIGELSPFHQTFGFYVEGVDLETIVLPDGWRERLVKVENANTGGSCGLCLEPTDLAVSKLAAARPKDLDFVRVLLEEGIVRSDALRERIGLVSRLDESQKTRILETVDRLAR